jgi:hypothetical protein
MLQLKFEQYPRRPLAPAREGAGAKVNREMAISLQNRSSAYKLEPQQALESVHSKPIHAAPPDYEGMKRFAWTSNPNKYTDEARADGWGYLPMGTRFVPCMHLPSFEPYHVNCQRLQ